MRLTFVAEGSVSDYSNTSGLQISVAKEAGVSPGAVAIIVEAASVRITATITLEADATVASVTEALGNSFATPVAASATLGITVVGEISIEITNTPSSPAASPPPSPLPVSSTNTRLPMWLLWALLPLCVLLVAALVLFYRYHYRILRDRANAILSRDRAHLDLQLIVHQVQRVQTKSDGSLASSKSRLPSMPPGPPSSTSSGPSTWPSTAQHMTEQRAPHPAWLEAVQSRSAYSSAHSIEVAVEEAMLDVETSEAIEEVMKETIVESNAIVEAMEEAIEEHRADIEAIEAIEEALAMPCAFTLLGSGLRLASGLGLGLTLTPVALALTH